MTRNTATFELGTDRPRVVDRLGHRLLSRPSATAGSTPRCQPARRRRRPRPESIHLPARRHDQVEVDQHHHRERGLAGHERRHLGPYAEPNATIGNRIHSTTGSTRAVRSPPRGQNPTAVPGHRAQHRVPVVSALLRNTDIAPSTTQNPCSTGNTCVTGGQSQAVRSLLRSTTALVARNPLVMAATATVSGITDQRRRCQVAGGRAPAPTPPGVRGRRCG